MKRSKILGGVSTVSLLDIPRECLLMIACIHLESYLDSNNENILQHGMLRYFDLFPLRLVSRMFGEVVSEAVLHLDHFVISLHQRTPECVKKSARLLCGCTSFHLIDLSPMNEELVIGSGLAKKILLQDCNFWIPTTLYDNAEDVYIYYDLRCDFDPCFFNFKNCKRLYLFIDLFQLNILSIDMESNKGWIYNHPLEYLLQLGKLETIVLQLLDNNLNDVLFINKVMLAYGGNVKCVSSEYKNDCCICTKCGKRLLKYPSYCTGCRHDGSIPVYHFESDKTNILSTYPIQKLFYGDLGYQISCST